MLLRFFKINQPFHIIVIPLLAGLLWLPSFINPPEGIAQLGEPSMPLYDILHQLLLLSGPAHLRVGFGLFFFIIQAYLIVRLTGLYNILEKRTYFSAYIFMFSLAAIGILRDFQPALIAAVFLLLALHRIFSTYEKEKAYANFFDSAFLISIGSLFYFNAIYCFLIVFVGLSVFRVFNWREWVIVIIGFGLPYFFLFSYHYIYHADWQYVFVLLEKQFEYNRNYVLLSNQKIPELAFLAYFIILILLSLRYFFSLKSLEVVVRKYYLVFVWLLVLLALFYFFIGSVSIEILYLFSIPACYLISNYLLSMSSNLWRNIFFNLLIAGTVAVIILS